MSKHRGEDFKADASIDSDIDEAQTYIARSSFKAFAMCCVGQDVRQFHLRRLIIVLLRVIGKIKQLVN